MVNRIRLGSRGSAQSGRNNDKDTIYLYKPSGARADVHSYTKSANDRDGNGYITYHG